MVAFDRLKSNLKLLEHGSFDLVMATLSQIFGILDLDLIGVFDFPSLSSEDSVIGDQCLFGFVSFRAFIRAFGAENVTRLTGGKRYSGAPLYTHVVSLTFTRGLLTG